MIRAMRTVSTQDTVIRSVLVHVASMASTRHAVDATPFRAHRSWLRSIKTKLWAAARRRAQAAQEKLTKTS